MMEFGGLKDPGTVPRAIGHFPDNAVSASLSCQCPVRLERHRETKGAGLGDFRASSIYYDGAGAQN
jgi:hypothetical protein